MEKLDEIDNWSQRLSPGEQQRLAFVRVLLTKPQMLFLDEASSALDPDTEARLYELILQKLPDAAIVSVAHREAVAKYHQVRWQFVNEHGADEKIAAMPQSARYTIQSIALDAEAAVTSQ
jgi:putative ATP-binding cassette transporter